MKDKKSDIIKIIIVSLGVLLICALCFFVSVMASENDSYSHSSSNSSNDVSGSDITSQAQAESSSIDEKEKGDFNDIDITKFLEMYRAGDKRIVLFSRPTCGYCQIAEPILQNIIYKRGIEINHVNTDLMSEEDFTTLMNMDSIFEDFGTPLLVVVSNDGVIDSVNGLTNTDGYIEFFQKNGFIGE